MRAAGEGYVKKLVERLTTLKEGLMYLEMDLSASTVFIQNCWTFLWGLVQVTRFVRTKHKAYRDCL